jgi:putative SOS response-associated peptidase YedK
MRDRTGNLPPMPGIFLIFWHQSHAPRPMVFASSRWRVEACLPPPAYGGAPVTNIRNVKSPRRRAWLAPEHRCVVPFTSFCEFANPKPKKTPTWFAFSEDRPLAFFADIWTTWHGKRGTKSNTIEGEQ